MRSETGTDKGALEGHRPPFGRHQLLASSAVSTSALDFVLPIVLAEAADQNILS
jgi:hypothetical protein